FEETGRTVGIIRDIFNPSFQSIYIDDKDVYNEVLNYVTLISPSSAPIVKFYSEDEPILDHFAITKQIKSSFGKTVSFKGGAYLIIEHTEALHVIDVNSGNRSRVSSGQEENAIDVNLLAANEISRQLRLRDLGGIIIVDFIDMASPEHRQQLFDRMRDNMANDRARHNILPLSKFGLLQITRQRVRPELSITTSEECPTCHGKGEIQPSLLFTDVLENKIEYMVETLHIKQFNMHVHPYIAAYINKGVISLKTQWKLKYGMGIKIVPNQNLAYLEYQFFDKDRNEIDLKEEKDLK
ncbi:MAG: ribonuclease E/G, partial [Bacteroidales bacterium]|nr:ribonuclease E/G [Bacteroidales bacterium]